MWNTYNWNWLFALHYVLCWPHEVEWNVIVEAVFEKLWKAGVFSDSVSGLIYLDVHDAVLAAVELDATLHQQVSCAAC